MTFADRMVLMHAAHIIRREAGLVDENDVALPASYNQLWLSDVSNSAELCVEMASNPDWRNTCEPKYFPPSAS